MATTKFSVITTGDNPSRHICVKELPGKHTYKVAVTVAKALMQEVKGEEIVAVVESWKLYLLVSALLFLLVLALQHRQEVRQQ